MSVLHLGTRRGAFAWASPFRDIFSASLTVWGDALFEFADALLWADGPGTTPVDLTLTTEHRGGHGALYDAWITRPRKRVPSRTEGRLKSRSPGPPAAGSA